MGGWVGGWVGWWVAPQVGVGRVASAHTCAHTPTPRVVPPAHRRLHAGKQRRASPRAHTPHPNASSAHVDDAARDAAPATDVKMEGGMER